MTTKTTTESIVCPECGKVQKAKIKHTMPFDTYIHECEKCKYIIMKVNGKELIIIMEEIKIMEEKSCRDCIYSETLTFRDGRTEATCHYSKPSKVVVKPCSKFTEWEDLKVSIKALDEVRGLYITYGHKKIKGTTDLSEWNMESDDSPENAKFYFTINFSGMTYDEFLKQNGK